MTAAWGGLQAAPGFSPAEAGLRTEVRPTWPSLAILLLLAFPAFPAGRAQLSGTIRDPSGSVVADATVTAVNVTDGARRSTRSNQQGEYALAALSPGTYKVLVRKPGFQTIARLNLALAPGQNAALDFALEIGSAREVITITADPAPVNTQDASAGGFIARPWLSLLPLNAGTFTGALDLLPGVVATPATAGEPGQFSASGQRPNTNYFTVDGVSANTAVTGSGLPAQFGGASLPSMTAFGSLHNLAPLEAVQEVRVQSSTFAPEFGRMPGAQIAITTRSGSNELHGSLSHLFRHEALGAADWFANAYAHRGPASRLNDFTATAGGPMRHNRTFFFTSIEALRLSQPYTWRTAVPSLGARRSAPAPARELLDAYPLPNGPSLGGGLDRFTATASRASNLTSGSLRLDHALTPSVTVFARYSRAPSSAAHGYAHVERTELQHSGITLGATAIASPALSYDLRLNAAATSAEGTWTATSAGGAAPLDPRRVVAWPGGRDPDLYGFALRGAPEIVAGQGGRNRQGHWNLTGSLDLAAERRRFRIGLDYGRLTPSRETRSASLAADYGTLANLLAGRAPVIRYAEADQASALIEMLSVFAQDTWRPAGGTAITYGARWEITPAPAIRGEAPRAAAPLPSPFPLPGPDRPATATATEARLWPTRYGQVAPRAGLAQRLANGTVLRAGWGLFYNVGFSAAADLINGYPFNRWQFRSGGAEVLPVFAQPLGPRFARDLRLPRAHHWNVAVEQELSGRDIVAASYIGSAGRDLLRREGSGAPGSHVADLVVATNNGSSNYHGLNVLYRRSVAPGLAATAAWTWSHAIDNGSWDSSLWLVGSGDRASASFDVRHAASASLVWDLPRSSLARGWRLSSIAHARTGFPVDPLVSDNPLGLGFDNATRPDLVPGAALWLHDRNAPGGRRLNPAAFAAPATDQGNLGRNAIAGFGMWQIDAALARDFALPRALRLEFRAEAFNVLNHANFADPVRYLDSPFFGAAGSMLNLMLGSGSPRSGLAPALQAGGPRSVRGLLRVWF